MAAKRMAFLTAQQAFDGYIVSRVGGSDKVVPLLEKGTRHCHRERMETLEDFDMSEIGVNCCQRLTKGVKRIAGSP